MKYIVHITQKAIDDMTEIAKYISDELFQPHSADKLLAKFEEKIYDLEIFPLRYPIVSDNFLSQQNIRKLPVENYIILYAVKDEKVHIIRVLYQKRNWTNLL